ncbi:uncharacterized protein Dana_GF27861 [Drosophila ananassae]|uniref:Uncharacterized protein n=1 Tax=Drosophila ananassae TaxID=7217 RepID=A0A0P9A466_DROAN|nr:uncharacterized protein Dana_GF27861 [Drosophila ananassae]
MNRRIYGGNYRPNLSSLVNLRVFAAILGLKFSGSRRWNFSLRHLFLLLSIFGFLFERFFICTLNSYFIKHPRYAAVTNFEQLRKCGLPLIVDKQITSFVMDNIDPNFFGKTVINIFTTNLHFLWILLILGYSLAVVVFYIEHHTDTKCSLREWNPRRYPTFRVTEESKIMIRGNCNDYAVALICMSQTSHIRLLDTVAYAYTNMRHERIILWFQAPLTPKLKAMNLKEIFQYIDSGTWFMYTIYVYAILIVLEGLIQIANCRIHGRRLGLTWMVIVNLRAFRSLLGMSFPIRRRTSLSLKQFFLAMSIFGMVFSSFFSCKLTSLMTKHSLKAEVTNMEELRASGLTVLSELRIRDLIESEWDPEYFHKTISKIEYRPFMDRYELVLSLNTTKEAYNRNGQEMRFMHPSKV